MTYVTDDVAAREIGPMVSDHSRTIAAVPNQSAHVGVGIVIRRAALAAALAFGLLAVPLAAQAEPLARVWRVGFLSPGSAQINAPRLAALEQGLRELGYTPGQNSVIEQRYADGHFERLPDLAAELVRLKVDVLIVHGTAALDAKKATATIPIVFIANPDPVGAGVVANLGRPGGNVTGLSDLHSGLASKRLELLKEVVPSASRIAVLTDSTTETALQLKDIQASASTLGVRILPVTVRAPEDLDRALATIIKERAEAVNVLGSQLLAIRRRHIAEFTVQNRLPAITTGRPFVEAGLLMSYGTNFEDLYRRAATFVDKILKGAKPADLPVEQPTKFEFVINMKTAKLLGLTIPPSLLLRADQVID